MRRKKKLVLLKGGPLSGQCCEVWGDHWVHPPKGKYKNVDCRPRYTETGEIRVLSRTKVHVFEFDECQATMSNGFEMPFRGLQNRN